MPSSTGSDETPTDDRDQDGRDDRDDGDDHDHDHDHDRGHRHDRRTRRIEMVLATARTARHRRSLLLVAAAVVIVLVATVVVVRRDDGGWAVDLGEQPLEGLVAGDGAVCGTGDRDLRCFDGATGELRFAAAVGRLARSFAIADGTVLVGHTPADELVAFSLQGDRRWEVEGSPASRPAVAGGVVAAPVGDGSELAGLDLATGEERWRRGFAPLDPVPGSGLLDGPVLTDGRSFYVAIAPAALAERSAIVAIDAASGEERWRAPIARSDLPPRSIAPFEDRSAVAFAVGEPDGHQRVVVLDTATGRLRWQAPLTDGVATVAQVDGVTVALSGTELRGYSATGDELWTTDAPTTRPAGELDDLAHFPLGELHAAHGTLYLDSRAVYAIDPATGESRVVVEDDIVDAAATAGHLVTASRCCIDPRLEGHPLE